jgi:hypothetical protein
MTRLAAPAAALVTALAAWISQGTLAQATIDGPRIALLPLSALALGIAAMAGAVVGGLARAGASLAPLCLLALVILPWLPIPVPAAFLVWSGSIQWLIWFAVALLLVASVSRRMPVMIRSFEAVASLVRDKPRLAAGALAFAIFSLAAWQVSPSIPGGDEPHYLVITQSLLLDGDLKIENNHRRGDHHAYFPGSLAPHYVRRGRDGEIYSIHAPGLAAIVAPAFAIAGYRGVLVFLIAVAALGSALAWHLASLATRSTAAAWFGWAAVTLSATGIFHSITVYPDGVGGVIALTGVWALWRAHAEATGDAHGGPPDRVGPWFLHGVALALLPWLHSRFAVLAGTLGALVLLRVSTTRNPAAKAVAFLSLPAVSALAWMAFFAIIYGTPDPSAPYGSTRDFSLAFVPGGLTGLLFDQRFGLIANAPVLLFGIGGLGLMLVISWGGRHGPSPAGFANRRLALELLFVVLSYLVTASSYAMWWAGWSAPARFASPALPVLAIPCAFAWIRIRHRATRVIAAGSLALTAFVSFVLVTVEGGRLAYNTRDALALWLEWASSLASIGEGMPVWFRGRESTFARDVAIWGAVLAAAWAGSRALETVAKLRDRMRFATAVTALHAVAGMLALTVVWSLHGTNRPAAAPAQLELLRRLATGSPALAMQLTPPRVLDPGGLLSALRVESVTRAAIAGGPFDSAQGRPGLGRNDQPFVVLPRLPAGQYRIVVRARERGGWIILGVGQDQFALRSEPLSWPPVAIDIDLPVDVRALVVRGDEEARRIVRSVLVEPIFLVPPAARPTTEIARRAVKYDGAVVYFLDEGAFPEPEAFWVGGSRQASFVIQSARPGGISLFSRNAPVANRVVVESGQWRDTLTMAPGEERQIEIPVAPGQHAALITISSESGFRPSETVPDSQDQRFLGVWLQVGNQNLTTPPK